MPRKPATKIPVPVIALKHKDKRANIPTKELRGFVAEDETRTTIRTAIQNEEAAS